MGLIGIMLVSAGVAAASFIAMSGVVGPLDILAADSAAALLALSSAVTFFSASAMDG